MTDYIVAFDLSDKKFVLKKISIYNMKQNQLKLNVDESTIRSLLTVDKVTQRCYINTGIELLDTMKTTNVDHKKK